MTALTAQQFDDIQTRADAATPGPWEEHKPYGPDFYAYLRGPYLRGVGTLNFGDGEGAEADREFVKHAREDVDALLATVRHLQGQRKFLLTQLAKRDAETGRGNTALREFLAGEPAEETRAVADDSSDPEHIDDCPGCEAFTLTGHRITASDTTPA